MPCSSMVLLVNPVNKHLFLMLGQDVMIRAWQPVCVSCTCPCEGPGRTTLDGLTIQADCTLDHCNQTYHLGFSSSINTFPSQMQISYADEMIWYDTRFFH